MSAIPAALVALLAGAQPVGIGVPRPGPTADLRFTRRAHQRGAAGRRRGRTGCRPADGQAGTALRMPIRVGTKSDTETGQRWITAELTLAPLAAGDYAIEQAPDGMLKVITAIRITR